ncbi:type VI secretion system-associated FHA domain protein TagH [Aquabacterium sp.]|uniref:type VI secretion system-associated FHA domain protein TagH n=1 Tax=Aquabacterium sp. TaxID=1872578 RepID=UPI002B86B1FD|nr:type VI secretion system-associated FHA domain protein TagH [Aquabacterium sp.]HSW08446.1 type VI secretion system-associated FHA domain protein TagH [Aquabacterium sp.]
MIVLRILQRPDGIAAVPDVHAIHPVGSTIGRAPDCDIVLDDPLRLVSRRHAWIKPEGGDMALLRCLSTTSELMVNEQPLPTGHECLVRSGDHLLIGGFEAILETRVLSASVAAAADATIVATIAEAQRTAPFERPPRLDQWFDLDTVPDPLGPRSPLPALDGAAPRPPGRPQRAELPSSTPAGAEPPWPATQLLRRDSPVTAGLAPDLPSPEIPSADITALQRAFLQGAGLPTGTPLTLSPAWMAHIGQLLRAATECTMGLLHSRAVTKRNLRTKGTGISARENNLLKFAPDATEALKLLLDPEDRPGFLGPVEAVHAAQKDLQVHQLAMMAGMRAAMVEMISRLGPEAVEAAADPPRGLARWVPAFREAQLWRRHHQTHARLVENLDEALEAAFGREFVRAYEAQASPGEAAAALETVRAAHEPLRDPILGHTPER